jgi:hypothetical protein
MYVTSPTIGVAATSMVTRVHSCQACCERGHICLLPRTNIACEEVLNVVLTHPQWREPEPRVAPHWSRLVAPGGQAWKSAQLTKEHRLRAHLGQSHEARGGEANSGAGGRGSIDPRSQPHRGYFMYLFDPLATLPVPLGPMRRAPVATPPETLDLSGRAE